MLISHRDHCYMGYKIALGAVFAAATCASLISGCSIISSISDDSAFGEAQDSFYYVSPEGVMKVDLETNKTLPENEERPKSDLYGDEAARADRLEKDIYILLYQRKLHLIHKTKIIKTAPCENCLDVKSYDGKIVVLRRLETGTTGLGIEYYDQSLKKNKQIKLDRALNLTQDADGDTRGGLGFLKVTFILHANRSNIWLGMPLESSGEWGAGYSFIKYDHEGDVDKAVPILKNFRSGWISPDRRKYAYTTGCAGSVCHGSWAHGYILDLDSLEYVEVMNEDDKISNQDPSLIEEHGVKHLFWARGWNEKKAVFGGKTYVNSRENITLDGELKWISQHTTEYWTRTYDTQKDVVEDQQYGSSEELDAALSWNSSCMSCRSAAPLNIPKDAELPDGFFVLVEPTG